MKHNKYIKEEKRFIRRTEWNWELLKDQFKWASIFAIISCFLLIIFNWNFGAKVFAVASTASILIGLICVLFISKKYYVEVVE